MQKVRMIAQGRVQGVGFRWGVYTLALEIGGITGRVWNNDDGTVEILAQADSFFKSYLSRCTNEQLFILSRLQSRKLGL